MSSKDISERASEIMARMKNRRIELDISYQALADMVGISKSTLQRYETGNIRNMPVDKLEAVAKALKVSPAYLMGWEDDKRGFQIMNDFNESTKAAHFDGTEYTEEQLDRIKSFAEFIKQEKK